ncbi:MAG: tyrosine-type recombinase/integrase [Acidimicrobiia bacterium]
MRPENVDDLATFREWLAAEQYARNTAALYERRVRAAGVALERQGVALRDADGDSLRAWWLTVPATSASRNQARKALSAFFRGALGRDDGSNPALTDLRALPNPHRLPRPLSPAELDAFVAGARSLGGDHELLGLLFALSGARFTEVRTARWSDFTLTPPASWRVTGKGSGRKGPKPRTVPIHNALLECLTGRSESTRTGFVFATPDPSRAVREGIFRDLFAEVCATAGLVGVTPHRLRHTVATQTLAITHDLRAVQELLGHASIATTELYTEVDPDSVRAIVVALPIANRDGGRPAAPSDPDDIDELDDVDDFGGFVEAVIDRASTVVALVERYRARDVLDTSPLERHLLATALCGVERALDALEGGY